MCIALSADIILCQTPPSQRQSTGNRTWGQGPLMMAPPRSPPAPPMVLPQSKKKRRGGLMHRGRRLGTSPQPGRGPQRSRMTFMVTLTLGLHYYISHKTHLELHYYTSHKTYLEGSSVTVRPSPQTLTCSNSRKKKKKNFTRQGSAHISFCPNTSMIGNFK